jgi:hypothetical protein
MTPREVEQMTDEEYRAFWRYAEEETRRAEREARRARRKR